MSGESGLEQGIVLFLCVIGAASISFNILIAVIRGLHAIFLKDRKSLKIKKLHPDAIRPKRESSMAAGYDLRSVSKFIVPAKGKEIIKTGLAIELPSGGYYGRIAPRSGLAVKNFIDVGAGVIDQDYRDELGVVLFNFSETDFAVNPGDRIAQLIIEKNYTPDVIETDKLSSTARKGGFGSTGTK
jgi:dUTP pyrophosphatase